MAKRKQTTKSGGVGRAVGLFILTVLLIAIVGCGSAWVTGWQLTGELNPLSWKKPTAQAAPQTVAIASDGTELKDGDNYAMPTGFTFLNTRSLPSATTQYEASGSIVLSATLDNPYINAEYTWSAGFADSSSEWASGKSVGYYVLVEPLSEGSDKAEITYLQPFCEQIILTVTVENGGSDSCTIDCVKPLELTEPWVTGTDFSDLYGMESFLRAGEGSVMGDVAFMWCSVTLTNSFQEALKSYLNFDITLKSCVNDCRAEPISLELEIAQEQYYFNIDFGGNWKYSMFIQGFDDYDEAHKDAIYYAWYQAYEKDSKGQNLNYYSNTIIDVEIEHSINGALISLLQESDVPSGALVGNFYAEDVEPSVTLNKNIVF